jgi:hypothetical protein
MHQSGAGITLQARPIFTSLASDFECPNPFGKSLSVVANSGASIVLGSGLIFGTRFV